MAESFEYPSDFLRLLESFAPGFEEIAENFRRRVSSLGTPSPIRRNIESAQALSLNENEALVLTFLLDRDEGNALEIAGATGGFLTKYRVTAALRSLKEKGWVISRQPFRQADVYSILPEFKPILELWRRCGEVLYLLQQTSSQED